MIFFLGLAETVMFKLSLAFWQGYFIDSKCQSALFIILVGLTVTLFSENMLISTTCIRGFMSNWIKKILKKTLILRSSIYWVSN